MGKIKIPAMTHNSLREFEGDSSVKRWQSEIEDMAIQMISAVDKRGLSIHVDVTPLIDGFAAVEKQIRDNMNCDVGDPITLIPGPGNYE